MKSEEQTFSEVESMTGNVPPENRGGGEGIASKSPCRVPHVLMVIDTAFTGGPGKGLLQLLRLSNRSQFTYTLITFSYRKPRSEQFIEEAQAQGANLIIVPHKHRLDPTPILKVLSLVKKQKVDIIQTHGYKGHVIAAAIKKITSISWLAFEHGLTFDSLRMKLYNRINYALLRRADVAIGVSQRIVDTLTTLRANSPTYLVRNAVETSENHSKKDGTLLRQELGLPDDTLLLGVIGRLSHEKGQKVLFRALQLIPLENTKRVHFLLVGEGPDLEILEGLRASSQWKNNVHFLGYRKDITYLMSAIDALVLPSLSEGLPNVVLEAMASGKAVVGTRVGEVPYLIDDQLTGWLVEPNNEMMLCNALMELIASDKEALTVIGERGRTKVKNSFSAQARVSRIVEIYNSCER
jgi:glycosyltransferase involved in cell wall biosynthesis